MKTVFTNQEVFHIFASGTQSQGRSHNGNVYFDGDAARPAGNGKFSPFSRLQCGAIALFYAYRGNAPRLYRESKNATHRF